MRAPNEKGYGTNVYHYVFHLLDSDDDLTGHQASLVAQTAKKAVERKLDQIMSRGPSRIAARKVRRKSLYVPGR